MNNQPTQMAKQGPQFPSTPDDRHIIQHDRPAAFQPIWFELQEAYSNLEHLSWELSQNHRLSVHSETVYNQLNLWNPYKPKNQDVSVEVAQERLTAVRLVIYFLEQLVASNPLLLPAGYEITNQDNCLKLTSAPKMGILEMRGNSMAPLLPMGTRVVWSSLKRKEWANFKGIVSVSLYSDFDADTVGRISSVTDESFVLKRDNPDVPDMTILWRNVVHMVSFEILAGAKIE